jgi:hypothetical protein
LRQTSFEVEEFGSYEVEIATRMACELERTFEFSFHFIWTIRIETTKYKELDDIIVPCVIIFLLQRLSSDGQTNGNFRG